jgi:hypothetical protein
VAALDVSTILFAYNIFIDIEGNDSHSFLLTKNHGGGNQGANEDSNYFFHTYSYLELGKLIENLRSINVRFV